jgi:hypothetical protein
MDTRILKEICTYIPNFDISEISSQKYKNLWKQSVINQVFRPSVVQQHTRLNIYRILARPVLTYGSEAWTIRKADEKRLQAAEMKFMRKIAGLTLLVHRRKEDILKNLKVEPISKFIQNYRAN